MKRQQLKRRFIKIKYDMKNFFNKYPYEIYFLVGILIFSFFIRVWYLGDPVFWIDEAISTVNSQNILEKGIPVLDSGVYYGRALFFHYIQAFFLLFKGVLGGEFLARFPSVIFGVLTVLLGYFIGKEYTTDENKKRTAGVIVALFLGICYFEVFYSMQARFYQLFQLLFFSSLYFLYKSKDNVKFLYISLALFVLALDTHLEGLVLAPFFIFFILVFYRKKWFLVLIPVIPLIMEFSGVLGISNINEIFSSGASEAVASSGGSGGNSIERVINYFSKYENYVYNIPYMLLLFIPGVVWSFIRKKWLTGLILLPTLIGFLGVLTLEVFAFRYIYFGFFIVIFYSSILMYFLYEKYGNLIFIAIFALVLIPSNLFFPYTYVNVIKPIDYQLNDPTAPQINLKELPEGLEEKMKKNDTTLVSYFSPSLKYYIKKPDYVLPFSMTGRGKDSISREIPEENKTVDVYSGAEMIEDLKEVREGDFYFIASRFAVSKLKSGQRDNIKDINNKCSLKYSHETVNIWYCEKENLF